MALGLDPGEYREKRHFPCGCQLLLHALCEGEESPAFDAE